MLIEVTTTVEVDVAKAWEDLWGNDGQGFAYWCGAVRDVYHGVRQDSFNAWERDATGKLVEVKNEWGSTDWIPYPHDFALYDSEDDKWYTVTVAQFAEAWLKWSQGGFTHCGGYSVVDDPDACSEDMLAQLCVFGEVIYG